MELTAQRIFDVVPTVARIIREERAMPVKGSFRLALLHRKLVPDFEVIAAKRDDIVRELGEPAVGEDGRETIVVPAERHGAFEARWREIADQSLTVDVKPIPLSFFDLGGASPLTAHDLVLLGDLIEEDGDGEA